jgi:peptide-methionine (R)-S-oxide reductase
MFTRLRIFIAFIGTFGIGLCSESRDLPNQEAIKMAIGYKNKPDSFWKKNLKPEVYAICRQKGTEAARSGAYDHFIEKGTYYCACCGGDHALYKSETKFDSGTGWPSFWEPVSPESVTLKEDRSGFFGWARPRTEVVCSRCGGHLGHVFDDGPKEYTGQRYCMNSLALTFIPEGQTPKNSFKENLPETVPQS